ncbi:MAG: hypothetical protein M3354_09510 [Chloroflexota bacterium]|nr:hypothetical protein [Chloroflexota bacterium]
MRKRWVVANELPHAATGHSVSVMTIPAELYPRALTGIIHYLHSRQLHREWFFAPDMFISLPGDGLP